jgi:hypothetical protein
VYKWKRIPKDKGIMPTSLGTTLQRKRQKYRGSKEGGGGGDGTDFRFCFICSSIDQAGQKSKLKEPLVLGISSVISVGFSIDLLLFIKVYIMCNCDNSKAKWFGRCL